MNNLYGVHSWSKLYREEALQEARKCHLEVRATTNRPHGRNRARQTLVASLMAALVTVSVFFASAACAPADGPGIPGDRPGVLDGIRLEDAPF